MHKGNSKIIVVSGPSGSGKTTLIQAAFEDEKIKQLFIKAITATTRSPRSKEEDGKDYLFFSKKDFLEKKKRGYFLETKKVLDNFYGSPKRFWDEARKKGKNLLLCIDVKGAEEIKSKFGKSSVFIFINVSSSKELEKRLIKRTSEDRTAIKNRLRLAKKEVKYAKKYHYYIENLDLAQSVAELKMILLVESRRRKNGC